MSSVLQEFTNSDDSTAGETSAQVALTDLTPGSTLLVYAMGDNNVHDEATLIDSVTFASETFVNHDTAIEHDLSARVSLIVAEGITATDGTLTVNYTEPVTYRLIRVVEVSGPNTVIAVTTQTDTGVNPTTPLSVAATAAPALAVAYCANYQGPARPGHINATTPTYGTFLDSAGSPNPAASTAIEALDIASTGTVTADFDNSSFGRNVSILTILSTGAPPITGTVGAALGSFTTAAAGVTTVAGSVSTLLSDFSVSVVAVDPDSSTALLTLGAFSMAASADVHTSGAAQASLSDFGVDIEGIVVSGTHQATVAATLSPFGVHIVAVTTPSTNRMTLAEIIPSILNGLVDGRVWQNATPDDLPRSTGKTILPFILWHRVGGMDSEYVDQTASDKRHARIQVSSNHPSAIGADRLLEAVMQTMLGSTYTVGVYGSPVGDYDGPRKLHAPFQQFSIWFKNPS